MLHTRNAPQKLSRCDPVLNLVLLFINKQQKKKNEIHIHVDCV